MDRTSDNGLTVEQLGDNLFEVRHAGQVLHTSMGGHLPIRHPNPIFLAHLVNELDERGKLHIINGEVQGPQGFDSYALLSLQYEWVDSRRDNLTTDLVAELVSDPFLLRSPSPEMSHQLPFVEDLNGWLRSLGVRTVDLDYVDLGRIDGLPADRFYSSTHYGDDDHSAFIDLRAALTNLYTNLTPQQRSVATYLTNIGDFFLYSLRLASGGCTPAEYGAAFAAARSTRNTAAGSAAKANAKQAEQYATRARRFIELASANN